MNILLRVLLDWLDFDYLEDVDIESSENCCSSDKAEKQETLHTLREQEEDELHVFSKVSIGGLS